MTDLDTLIVTFQTQLSDVMETVVKSAMFEVTRLVEDGFVEEVKRRNQEVERRNQEVESLRMQLLWLERKLRNFGGREGRRRGRCVDCAKDGVELSCEAVDKQTDDPMSECSLKKEAEHEERQTRTDHREEVRAEASENLQTNQQALSAESQTIEDGDDVLPEVEVKGEEVMHPSCSLSLGGWTSIIEGEAGPEPNSAAEFTEEQAEETEESCEELLSDSIKFETQASPVSVFSKELEETHMGIDPSLDVDSDWTALTVPTAGLKLNLRQAAEKECNLLKSTRTVSNQELSDSITAEAHVLVGHVGDQISSLASPKAGIQRSDVTIKQEVTVDLDERDDREPKERTLGKSRISSFSSLVKQHRASQEVLKHNPISQKVAVQHVMKLHSKVGSGLRLQDAIQQLQRSMKKPPQSLPHSSTAAPSAAHSQAGNLNHINRIPTTSKAAPAPLSVQRVHKQAAGHNCNGTPWVSNKTHHPSPNSLHASTFPHSASNSLSGPRHLQRCGHCGKCFPHPSNLKAHLQTHTGERPFCCALCGRSFTKLSNLKAHRRVHTGERPYSCSACGKRFTQKCNLKRHQRIHLDVV